MSQSPKHCELAVEKLLDEGRTLAINVAPGDCDADGGSRLGGGTCCDAEMCCAIFSVAPISFADVQRDALRRSSCLIFESSVASLEFVEQRPDRDQHLH